MAGKYTIKVPALKFDKILSVIIGPLPLLMFYSAHHTSSHSGFMRLRWGSHYNPILQMKEQSIGKFRNLIDGYKSHEESLEH